MPFEFLASGDVGRAGFSVELPPGATLSQTDAVVQRLTMAHGVRGGMARGWKPPRCVNMTGAARTAIECSTRARHRSALGDGPIAQFRRWFSQFYAPASDDSQRIRAVS